MKFRGLMEQIERVLPDGGQWCSLEKAQTLAALVIGARPSVIVEIGVWMGGSLIPMALAAQRIDGCKVIGIDPWNTAESVKGQNDINAEWWGQTDHEIAHTITQTRIHDLDLGGVVEIRRMPSELSGVPITIDLLHIDGNHAEQAVRDAQRFAPAVPVGGYCVLDDIGWSGGHVARAGDVLKEMGFREMYELDPGMVYQRRRA